MNGFIKLILIFLLINHPAFIQAKQLAYAGCNDNTMHRFDVTQPANPIETLPAVSVKKPWDIAFTPNGKFAYIVQQSNNNVVMIDTQTGEWVGSAIPTGSQPFGLAVTPDGQFLYVCSYGGADITVISTATNTVVGHIAITGADTYRILFTPDGKYAYASGYKDSVVHVIDTTTREELTGPGFPIAVGGKVPELAITPDGNFVYIVLSQQNKVEIIDTSTNTLLSQSIPIVGKPRPIAITPDGHFAYIGTMDAATVSVIDIQNQTLLTTISNPNMLSAHDIEVTPDNKYVYITDYSAGCIHTIDIQTQAMIVQNHPIPLGITPLSVAVSPGTMEVSAQAHKTNSFLATDYYNTITWTAPTNPFSLHYNIYRDREQKVLIATIDGAGELKYEDHKRTPGSTYHYYITAENPYGIISIADTSITINN